MQIIPAIDLKDGQCVRLRKGVMEDSTVFSSDPVAVARQWVEQGARRLHLVDLNGAFAGKPVNGEVVTAIAKAFPRIAHSNWRRHPLGGNHSPLFGGGRPLCDYRH